MRAVVALAIPDDETRAIVERRAAAGHVSDGNAVVAVLQGKVLILPVVPHAVGGRVPVARVLREREGFILREDTRLAEIIVEKAAFGQRRFLHIAGRVLLRCVRRRRFAAGGQEKREGENKKKRFFHMGPS